MVNHTVGVHITFRQNIKLFTKATVPCVVSSALYESFSPSTCQQHNIVLNGFNLHFWKIPWMEEPGGLQSMGLRTRLSDFTFSFHFHALEKETVTHSSVLAWRIPGTGGAWWAAVYGVAQSWTRLKRLRSSSSSSN